MEETVIYKFEIDQGKAEQDLKKMEVAILNNKEAQQELNKAYKAGNITQEEYVEENIRLQQNLKKENEQKKNLIKTLETESNSRNALRSKISELVKQYDNLNLKTKEGEKRAKELQKELTKLNNELTKGDKAAGLFKNQIGNYPQQFAQAAKGISIAGVSVGDLTTRFSSFLNPATAAVGILGGLVTAYATSTAGARDLQKATDALGAGFALAQESYANFVQELTNSSNNRGILEQATTAINTLLFGVGTANQADAIAAAKEVLRQLEISRAFAAADAKNDERRAEIARRNRDDEKKSFQERLEFSKQIDEFLERSGERTKVIIQAQINGIINSTIAYDKNREAQLLVAQLTAEIADKEEEITGKLTENVAARQKIIDQMLIEAELRRIAAADAKAQAGAPGFISPDSALAEASSDTATSMATLAGPLTDDIVAASEERQAQFIKEVDTVGMTEEQKQEYYRQTAALQERLAQEQLIREQQLAEGVLAIGSSLANGLAALAKEESELQKALALTGIAFDTASAIAGGVAASQDIPYPGNLAAMASTIAAVLSAIAQAEAVISGYAEGGYTGDGPKYKPAGIVHAGEVVWSQRDVAMAGGPAMADSLRPTSKTRGYADGGYVANVNTQPAQQSMIVANALRNMPPIYASMTEARAVLNKLEFKERRSTL